MEEDDADNDLAMGVLPRDHQIMPRRTKDEVKRLGGVFTPGGLWRGYAVRDDNLITDQRQFSGRDVGEFVVRAIGE
jgi:hypothetical protein